MTINEKTRIAIVGGGPGGLTLARLLQNRGATVKVYERDVSRAARVQGATLNINAGSGLLAIERAGLREAFQRAYRPGAEALVVADHTGKTLLDDFGGGPIGEERPEIDRGPLRDLLLDSLREDTVVWDRRFVAMTRKNGSIELQFEHGHTAEADLVIAADGASSKLRPFVTSLAPKYSGIMIVEGVIDDLARKLPRIHEQLNGGKLCVLGHEKVMFVVLKGDGSAAFYVSLRASENALAEPNLDFKTWFRDAFPGWDAFHGVFDASELFMRRPQYCAPVDRAWDAHSDITMIGDAAHVMPPFAGEGVNMAMLDAVELSDALFDTRYSSTKDAIDAFESKMRGYAGEAAAQTMEFTEIFHSPEAIPFFVRFFSEAGPGPGPG